ncbi:MAG: O-antigen ligase family protein [Chloroflexi bacterium]|nr:O-antigen ligase family protein [Chloroflexota bacterium]
MIESDTSQAVPSPQPGARRIWAQALAILGIVALALVGVAVAYAVGKRIAADQWRLLLTASALATYLAISLIDARHGLLLWIVTAPFARFAYLDLELGAGIPNLTLNRIMTGWLLVLLLAQFAVRSRRLPRIVLADVLLLAFLGASALSVPHAIVGLQSAVQSFFDLLVIPTAIYFLARCLITNQEELRGVMVALLIVGLYLGLLATREQLTGDVWFYPEDRSVQYTASIRRVVGLLGNPAYIAVTIDMTIPFAWYLFFKARHHRLGLILIILAMMAGVFFCMNRSGWVGLVVALIVLALFVRRFRPIFFLMVMLALIVAGSYWALITTSAAVQERLTAQGPIDYRMETWDVAWRMIRDNPIFGIGYENFRLIYSQYGYWDVYLRATPTPHNTFLWVMLMGGIVALLPYVLFWGAALFLALGAYLRGKLDSEQANATSGPDPDLAGAFLASMAAILVPSLVMDVFQGYYNTMIMFLILGAFLGTVIGEQRIHASPSLWQRVRAVLVQRTF